MPTPYVPRPEGPRPPAERIERRILTVRGQKMMVNHHLADLYGVTTRELVQAVKRNLDRFPEDFMCQLTADEFTALRSQFVISNVRPGRGGRRYRPHAFTEQGVAMLSSVLRSPRAIRGNNDDSAGPPAESWENGHGDLGDSGSGWRIPGERLSSMRIEVEREVHGRWIAEVTDLSGVMAYGATKEEAIRKMQGLAFRVLADRLEQGEPVPGLAGLFREPT